MFVNKMRFWALKASALSHLEQVEVLSLELLCSISILLKDFAENFPSSHFPLSVSSHFHFPLHHQRASSMAPQFVIEALNQAWEGHCVLKNNAWSKHWTRPESSPTSLPSSVIVSIPLSPSPKCNMYLPGAIYISLSLSIFHVHGLVWVFCWMWKRVFDLKYWCWLWLVRQHSSIIFLNIKFYWMHWYIKVLMLVWVFMNFLSSTFVLNPKC